MSAFSKKATSFLARLFWSLKTTSSWTDKQFRGRGSYKEGGKGIGREEKIIRREGKEFL
jgi:hypothetical protein